MVSSASFKDKIGSDGFCVINDVFSASETEQFISIIDRSSSLGPNFRKHQALFAIRNLLSEIPELAPHLWTARFNDLIDSLCGSNYHNTKAIYFDKPAISNWLVPWHQDVTISVDRKEDVPGFGPWTAKENLVSVQPTKEILDDIVAIRIHLDDCDDTNGALRVVPGTHRAGVVKNNLFESNSEPIVCNVKKGGVMIMKPLLWHSSCKSTSDRNRRVIHLEFSSKILPAGLAWREFSNRKLK